MIIRSDELQSMRSNNKFFSMKWKNQAISISYRENQA